MTSLDTQIAEAQEQSQTVSSLGEFDYLYSLANNYGQSIIQSGFLPHLIPEILDIYTPIMLGETMPQFTEDNFEVIHYEHVDERQIEKKERLILNLASRLVHEGFGGFNLADLIEIYDSIVQKNDFRGLNLRIVSKPKNLLESGCYDESLDICFIPTYNELEGFNPTESAAKKTLTMISLLAERYVYQKMKTDGVNHLFISPSKVEEFSDIIESSLGALLFEPELITLDDLAQDQTRLLQLSDYLFDKNRVLQTDHHLIQEWINNLKEINFIYPI